MSILAILRERFRPAIAQLGISPDKFLSLILPVSNPQFGDYQANCAMPLAKQLKRSPRDVASSIVEHLPVEDLCETPEIAGPGFINLRLMPAAIAQRLQAMRNDHRLGIAKVDHPLTYVIDFSSPNVAKPMHVGHIRSTALGDSLTRLLRFAGHRVITDNHLGDWGTQFGMIIYGYKHFLQRAAYEDQPVAELSRLYLLVRRLMDALDARDRLPELSERKSELEAALQRTLTVGASDGDAKKKTGRLKNDLSELDQQINSTKRAAAQLQENAELVALASSHDAIREAVLLETAKLHAGDATNVQIWEEILPACRQEMQRLYDRLSIRFDHELGESFYHDQLSFVVQSLVQGKIANASDGAICVFLDGFQTPMIVQKSDGAFLYSTTDLATIAYRMRQWKPDVMLYVVDFRQGEHFAKLFAATRKWGYDGVHLQHVSFGTVLGADHRPFKTRAGDAVGLEGLLDEAERRAYAVVCETDDKRETAERMSDGTRREVAKVVGIAAIKYADLSQNRTSDYVFDYDKMLSLQGNTATYMQYSYARVHGIFAKGKIDAEQIRRVESPLVLATSEERALAVRLLQFGEALDESLVDYRPNLLTNYLYELAKCFSSFFETCPVLNAESPDQRTSRLQLCDLTARTLRLGLGLLGIDVVESM